MRHLDLNPNAGETLVIPPRSPRHFAPLALHLALLALAATGHAAEKPPTNMTVAVLEFANASSEPGLETLGKGLQSMLTTDLARVQALTLVERSRLQDIVAEQKLSQSGLIDKTTAAKIGKLVGASHLLGGTYTVVGGTMRLDARLFAVKGGDVLLAEEMTGEKDAFFELEKQLVNKLVSTLGVKLDAKERANLARIHTADFGAFTTFSQGVAAFDQQKYDEAMEKLRAAMQIDGEFNLARVTLDEYEQLVAKIRSRAQNIELSERELEKLKKDQDFARDSAIAQRLLEIANETGPQKVHRRLAALHYLIGFYNPHGRNHGRISRFQDHFDGLLVRRRADSLARRYFTEAQAVFPDAPLFSFGGHPPEKPEQIEERIAGLAKALKQGLEHRPENRDQGLINNLRKVEDFASLAATVAGVVVAVDRRERIKLYELAFTHLTKLKADAYALTSLLNDLAEAYLMVGDVDHASGALARASAVETDSDDLKRLATRLEELGKVSKLLAKTSRKDELREIIARHGNLPSGSELAWFEDKGPAPAKLMRELAESREPKRWFSHADPFWIWSGEPAYLLDGEYVITTGPRTDGLQSRDVHYYKSLKTSTKDALLAMGRGARTDLSATFELNFKAPKGYWPRHASWDAKTIDDLTLDAGRPEVIFVFGLHSIDTDNVQDPETRKHYYPEPTRGFGVRFLGDKVELVRLGDEPPAEKLRQSELTVKVIDSESKKLGDKTKVQVSVKGKTVTVTAGGTFKFTLPSEPNGFVGAHFKGVGFAAIEDL
ncbi:MAG TPA: CsgG/HfaB family protein, partial [Myxococcota bacterium]|nr:CsgG/HfaB family protein [Myxococcota bacterium]